MEQIINEAKAYLHRIGKYIRMSLILFAAAVFFGFWAAQNYPEEIGSYLEEMQSFFASMESPTSWGIFINILGNNVEAMLTVVLLGIFAGLFSFTFLLANGFVVGVFLYLYDVQGLLPVFVMGILPHGIFEIPAMLFSAAIGLRIGATAVKKLFRKKESLTRELAEGIKFTVLCTIPVLALAAFIEAYATPYFIAWAESGFAS